MNKLLVGGNGAIKIVLLVKWTKHSNNSVTGVLELHRNDRQGIPQLRQTKVIGTVPVDMNDIQDKLESRTLILLNPQALEASLSLNNLLEIRG
jgi:hypothetical protein